jgi:hypothetical protein
MNDVTKSRSSKFWICVRVLQAFDLGFERGGDAVFRSHRMSVKNGLPPVAGGSPQ